MQKTLAPMIGLVVLFAFGLSWDAWVTNKRYQVRQLAALTEVAAASLDLYLAKLEATLHFAAEEMLRIDRAGGSTVRVLDGVRTLYPEIGDVRVVLGEDTNSEPAPEVRLAGADATARRQAGRLGVERPVWLAERNEWVVPLRYAMRPASGYGIHAVLPLAKAHRLWTDAPLPVDARLGVIRDDGRLVSLYPLPDDVPLNALYGFERTRSPLYAALKADRYPQRGTVEGAGSVNGKPRLWVYRRLDHYPLTLYTSLPSAFLWQTWWFDVRHAYLLLALGMLGGIGVYVWIVRRQRAWEIAHQRAEQRIRRLNRALAQRVAQLEASNRELEAFSYTVSHDLRGPLRVIHGFSERLALQSAHALDDKSLHCLQRIKVGAYRMGELIDGLLQLSRVARAKIDVQPVDLTHEAKSIVRELQQLYPDRNVRFSVEEGLIVRGSRPLLRDLLRNLLENAWKFTVSRPEAVVSLGREVRDGERAYVVRDNGIGFDMQYGRKLFTAFQRLHGADYEGVGIGLATVARIAAMHGGRVWTEAKKNEGAAFFFVLEPRRRDHCAAAAVSTPPEVTARRQDPAS